VRNASSRKQPKSWKSSWGGNDRSYVDAQQRAAADVRRRTPLSADVGPIEMKPEEYEWVSAPLEAEQLQAVVESLPVVLKELLGDALFKAMYGWGCNLHMDLCYVPMTVGTRWADRFIKDSLEQRIFVPAGSDMYFELPDERLELLFCHEGDIHVSGPDSELRERLFNSPAFRDVPFTKHRKEAQQSVQPDRREDAAPG
jgi:hypothetical protein